VLGVEASGWLEVVDGVLLSVGDGSGEATDPSNPADAGESLVGGGEPLGVGGDVSELPPLGVVSEVGDDGSVDGGGLVDPAEGSELGTSDGAPALDGPSAEEGPVAESELGTSDVSDFGLLPPDGSPGLDGSVVEDGPATELGSPDAGDPGLLPGNDAGDVLGAESPGLLPAVDGAELAAGLIDSPGLPDGCEPDASLGFEGDSALAESGDAELGGASLVDGALLGAVDGVDWLSVLDGPGLASEG